MSTKPFLDGIVAVYLARLVRVYHARTMATLDVNALRVYICMFHSSSLRAHHKLSLVSVQASRFLKRRQQTKKNEPAFRASSRA